MLFYRKKILLALLEAFNSPLDSLRFQKYLFLTLEQLNKKYYSFVPYQYGCFSFESYNDKRSLMNLNFLMEDDKNWILNKNNNFLSEIKERERKAIFFVKTKYGDLSKKALLNQVYSKYPYYAINSRIIKTAGLSDQEEKVIENSRPKQTESYLFTIGYEGLSIDEYLNLLIKHNIKILYDVRKNPLSRKYGFSKKSLQKKVTDLNIEYLHLPDLGIDSHLRKNLKEEQNYKDLFYFYKQEILPTRTKTLNNIINNFQIKKRIALTCFESEPNFCHRNCISSVLKKTHNKVKIKHL